MKPEECLFCKIVERKIHSAIVYDSEDVLGFKDIHPQAPVHVLFVPKKHFPDIRSLPIGESPILDRLFLAANHSAVELGVRERGYRLVINCGKEGGQSVDHLHLHLLGGRPLAWPPG